MITIEDLEHLGPALGVLRRRADLLQKEISTQTGMSRSQVSRYERSRDVPNLTTLTKYLEVVKADFQLLHRAIVQAKQDSAARASGLTSTIDPLAATADEAVDLNDLLCRLERVEAVLRLRPATESGLTSEEDEPDSEVKEG